MDEVLDCTRQERRKTLEIEHSSGGLLNLQTPDETAMTVSLSENLEILWINLVLAKGPRRITIFRREAKNRHGFSVHRRRFRRSHRTGGSTHC